ncbi:hypothetical protein PCANC_17595 [Puccinia coronata f. sp. avenae]|uniref:Helitron helicase-like domain-containing protein n=1 Tax=Puccinia coronata f. sp. avenae TaxID=200324 RepID=A0A2N5VN02_9BASI|nr:hypothetical protein PCANC_17595 [Puccinia coronata f. sp. avenae]
MCSFSDLSTPDSSLQQCFSIFFLPHNHRPFGPRTARDIHFRVSGSFHHDIGRAFPLPGEPLAFAQIYVTGGNDLSKAQTRAHQARSATDLRILLHLQQFLTANNSYARFFRMIGRDISPNQDHQFVLRHFQRPDLDRRVYNAPRTQEVGMDEFSGYLPIRYPIFFPYGEQGWTHASTISQCEWYAHMIFDRPGAFIAILRGKNLYQEFLVNVYICVERSRLNFIWFNQAQLKADIYKGLQESFRDDLDIEGRRVILPSSFSGSPQSMLQLYQDSMASVWQFGKPLLFITMTANAHWPEINAALKPGETPSD